MDLREDSPLASTRRAHLNMWSLQRQRTHFTQVRTTRDRTCSQASTTSRRWTIYTTKETLNTINNFTPRKRATTDRGLRTIETSTSTKRRSTTQGQMPILGAKASIMAAKHQIRRLEGTTPNNFIIEDDFRKFQFNHIQGWYWFNFLIITIIWLP